MALPLPLLERLSVLPDQYTDRSRALTLLKRIDYIEICGTVKRDGYRHYVVNIHNKLTQHRIPKQTGKLKLPKRNPPSASSCKPDASVLRRFSEFNNVSDEMYFHAHAGHEKTSCAFCKGYLDYMTISPNQPGVLMKLLRGDNSVQRLLECFLNDVLRMTVNRVKAFGGQDCLGQEHVPLLLLEFLLPQEVAPSDIEGSQLSVQALREATRDSATRSMLNSV